MLQWFRKKLREGKEAPSEAAPPAQLEDDRRQAAEDAEGADAQRPRRRRGSRGGRGRSRRGAAKVAEKAPVDKGPARKEKPAEEKEKERARRPRRSRTPAKRSELPAVRKEIYMSVEVGETRVAVLEDGRPAEVYLERPGRRSIAGNVYKGVVDNVLPGMEASFVEIGLERNGFLYVDEIVVPELEGKRQGRRIQELVERGQSVLVQAVKDPMGTKGARLTTEISLPGRFLVYVPFGEGIGISRRLEDAERERLKAISKELELPEGGIIVRTAAEGASADEIAGDLALLRKLWSTIKGRADRTEAPSLVYQEAELPVRIVRDLFIRDFERVVVDHERTYRRIVGYLKRTSRDLAERVELYGGKEPLMQKAGVEDAIRSTLNPRVDLPSGGYLIFDYAEAFTAIDVNTGRFVGARGKGSGARLEDTITKNNLEAVEEVVRQLRLRDIGGIIVIDFIDMANPKNRQLVEEALKRELERDRTKTYVVEISPLGLVEMTRQNVTDGPREILTVTCPACEGEGVVVSDETHAVSAERKLRGLVAMSRHQAFKVEISSRVAALLIGPGASRLQALEQETGRRFFFETSDELPGGHFAVLEKGPISRLETKSLPVSTGQELELRLEEAHLHDERDAIARLNGYVVAVAGAKDKIGKTVKVRVERATRTAAYAVLADSTGSVEPPVEAGTELEIEVPDLEAVGADGEPPTDDKPRKRTRRGSRGGRGRRKKTEAVSGQGAEAVSERTDTQEPGQEPEPAGEPPVEVGSETPSEPEAERAPRRRSPRIHVPPVAPLDAEDEPAAPASSDGSEPESGPDGEPKPKKKTRRGTRGGRNRRRKRVGEEATADPLGEPATDPLGEAATDPAPAPVASVAGDEEGG